MSLKKSASDKDFKFNIRSEIHAGRPPKQAVAIAYSVKRRSGKHIGAPYGILTQRVDIND